MSCTVTPMKSDPARGNQRERKRERKNLILYLSVKFSSTVQEGLANVMQPICVTCWVFQASKRSAANLEGTVEAACHICCVHREWSVSMGTNSGFTGNHWAHYTRLAKDLAKRMQPTKGNVSYFGDSQKMYSYSMTWLEIGCLKAKKKTWTVSFFKDFHVSLKIVITRNRRCWHILIKLTMTSIITIF